MCNFAKWIVGGHVPMTSGKPITASTLHLIGSFKRYRHMKRLDSEFAKQNVKRVLGETNYSFEKFQYETAEKKVIITCKKHGDFKSLYHNLLRGHGCPRCKAENHKKIILGVGINDFQEKVVGCDNKYAYRHWRSMINRCYNDKVHKIQSCYIGCSVCKEWILFSNFKKWFDDNYIEGYQLDKDILVKNNTIYSPNTCCFVPQEINHLLVKPKINTKSTPVGVTRKGNKYRVIISKYGKINIIGYFENKDDAFAAYKQAKESHIQEVAQKSFDNNKITKKVYDALMNYKVEITD